MAHLSLGVLGSLQVLIDDTPVTMLESNKVCAFLVYLAVEADRPHRRESLAGLLWPDYPEQVARHNLRQALFNLRLAIGDHTARPPYLLISRDAIQFNRASDFSLDLAQFNTILHTCKEDRNQGIEDPSVRAARLEELVKLYRGEFLQGFSVEDSAEFEEWVLVQRESLHQQILDACSDLANYYELHGDFPIARRHALRQLELDPWREEAHCQLMRTLALDGQRSAALAQYETCRRVLAEELGVEPSANTRELVEQIRTGMLKAKGEPPSSIPSAPIHNLPVSLTSFLGRDQELIDLDRLIANPECRFISLVGPGGIGKTRLALQAGEQHRADFAHGVVFIPLAPIGSVEAAIPAIANAIHLYFYGQNNPKMQLLNYLCEKHMLLIFDNVEHLLIGGPPQANIVDLMFEILQSAPGVKLLVTSREVLNLQEEWVFDVGGLAFPKAEKTERLDEFAAVALFIQRARRASPGFAFHEADLAGIAHICRLVEGMPLAIELAATWLRILSPAEIAKEIEGSLDALNASVRDLPERHRSMRVVFDQTWQRLSAKEQRVISHLSVFRSGFSRQAAEQVAGATLPVLSTLVNRTLLRRSASGRYHLHSLVRQYCTTYLVADPQAHVAAQKCHYDYFLALAEAAEQGLKGRDQLEWLGRLEQEYNNFRAALEWAIESDHMAPDGAELALRLSGALRWFWRMRGHFHEGRSWLMQALQTCPERPTAARASALLGLSMIMNILGELGTAHPQAEESAEIFRKLGNQQGLAEALSEAGATLTWQGEAAMAFARFEEALALYRKAGDRWGEAQVLYRLGGTLLDSSCDPMGRDMLEESTRILEDLGEKYLYVYVLILLGVTETQLGNYTSARTHLERGLAVATEIRHPGGVADALTSLGDVCRIQGEYLIAQSRFEAAYRVYQEHGSNVWDTSALCFMAENEIAQGNLCAARLHILAASNRIKLSENQLANYHVCYFRGLLAYYEEDTEGAAELFEEVLALARQGIYKVEVARSALALARVRRTLGEVVQATELVQEGLDLFSKYGHKLGVAIALEELAALCAVQRDEARAVMLLSVAHALRERLGAPLPPVDRAAYDSVLAACRAQLGEAVFERAWAEGKAMSLEQAIDFTFDR